MLQLLAFATLLCAQDGPPAPDRSGEPALRQILKSMSAMQTHVTVRMQARESAEDVFYPDSEYSLHWMSPKVFRLQQTSYWGDARLYVADGTTLLRDPLDRHTNAVLSDLKEMPWESDTDLGPGGDNATVIVLLLSGEKAWDKLVDKDTSITLVPSQDGLEGVLIRGKAFGDLTLLHASEDAKKVVREARYDNKPSRLKFHQMYPEWVGPPVDGMLTVESYEYRPMSRSATQSLFKTNLPPGVPFEDKRKKKAS